MSSLRTPCFFKNILLSGLFEGQFPKVRERGDWMLGDEEPRFVSDRTRAVVMHKIGNTTAVIHDDLSSPTYTFGPGKQVVDLH